MNNDEIKKTIQKLSEAAEKRGSSSTVRIQFDPEPTEEENASETVSSEESERENRGAGAFFAGLVKKGSAFIDRREKEEEERHSAGESAEDADDESYYLDDEEEYDDEDGEYEDEASEMDEYEEEDDAPNRADKVRMGVDSALKSAGKFFGKASASIKEKAAEVSEARKQRQEQKKSEELARQKAAREEADQIRADLLGTEASGSGVGKASDAEKLTAGIEASAVSVGEIAGETEKAAAPAGLSAGDAEVSAASVGETAGEAENMVELMGESDGDAADDAAPAADAAGDDGDAAGRKEAADEEAEGSDAGAQEPAAGNMDDAEPEAEDEDADNTSESGTKVIGQDVFKKRITPVEPADFDSDADEFRSTPVEETEEEQRSIKERYDLWRARMALKGIGTRELAIICAGILVILILLVVGISMLRTRQKSKNVAADDGLTVTVEKEPSSWTRQAEVTLGIRTGSAVQSLTVNGEDVEVENSSRITVTLEAASSTLALRVMTANDVLNATVSIPYIDAEAPVLTLSEESGLVTIDAVDNGSGVEAVYVGKYEGWNKVPGYELYTGAFAADKGTQYAYYAVDRAGNMTPVRSTVMEQATELTVNRQEVSLFPGDTCQLEIGTVPAGAFTNGRHITVSDETVITVNDNGLITAVADGNAEIVISADGLNSITVPVTVRTSASATISAIGDVTLGDDENFSPLNSFSTVQSMNGSSYFFQNVSSVLGADDLTFANFEGTLTNQGQREYKTYAFKGDPSYTQILTEGSVEAVTLANNHSRDYGEVSYTDTQTYLSQAGITWVDGETISIREVSGVKVGLVGIYVLDDGLNKVSQAEASIAAAKQQGADVVVAAFHWGDEGSDTPNDTQIAMAHAAVDAGADLVVGHHPHVLQGIEVYNGVYIAYSLGNFCFGGNSNPMDMDTMILQAEFTVTGTDAVSCEVKVIPCSISSDTTWNNYQPTIAEGERAQSIMDKINERSAMFGTQTLTYEG